MHLEVVTPGERSTRWLLATLLLWGLLGCEGVAPAEDVNEEDSAKNVTATAAIVSSVAPLAIGDVAPDDLTFTDIRYLPRTLCELGEHQAFVLVFTTLECPIVRRYLPRLKQFDEEYRDRDVQFVAINVGPNDPIVEIAYQAVKADIGFPFCKDFDGSTARMLGITRTPEVVVLDAERRLRYRGRIDDQIRFAGPRPKASREDLRLALEAVLAGKDVEVTETEPDGCLVTFVKPSKPDPTLTYHEHVAPILEKHCTRCHRPSTAAPFTLTSYDDASSYAEMIAEVVQQRRMPPWFASAEHGEFLNRPTLSADERRTIVDWARGERREGEPPTEVAERAADESVWQIGQPDMVLTIEHTQQIPAEGVIPYRYARLPHLFEEDTWIQRVEVLPGNRDVVHHANLLYVVPGRGGLDGDFITGFVPGGDAMQLDQGLGLKIPKGAQLVLQIHYVTAGYEAEDATRVGLVFARQRIEQRLRFQQGSDSKLAITPGDPHWRSTCRRTFENDSTGIALFSHMHYRGKDMMFRAIYPDGSDEMLLAVPNYSFDWQMGYRFPPGEKKFSAGTTIEVVAHFDNSEFNPYNPDPTATVREGRQSFQEMMYGWVLYTEDDEQLGLDIDPETGHVIETADATPAE